MKGRNTGKYTIAWFECSLSRVFKKRKKITARISPSGFFHSSMYLSSAAFKIALTVSPRSFAFCLTSSA